LPDTTARVRALAVPPRLVSAYGGGGFLFGSCEKFLNEFGAVVVNAAGGIVDVAQGVDYVFRPGWFVGLQVEGMIGLYPQRRLYRINHVGQLSGRNEAEAAVQVLYLLPAVVFFPALLNLWRIK